MDIKIETVPHQSQNYNTAGDWRFDVDGNIIIKVSEVGDWRMEMLVAIHELCEAAICKHTGTSVDDVDIFDINFKDRRKDGNVDEPGDDSHAPYRRQHCIATGVERIICAALDVDWKRYEDKLNSLEY
jgi:hypothetical protein